MLFRSVLYRIEKIKNMKDDISLDDLADVFSPSFDSVNMRPEEITQRNIVSPNVMEIYTNFRGNTDALDFNDILSAYILDRRIVAGDIGMEEGKQLLEVLQAGRIAFAEDPAEIFMTRKLGVFSCFAVSPPCRICTDNGVRLIATVNTASVIEELKCKLI